MSTLREGSNIINNNSSIISSNGGGGGVDTNKSSQVIPQTRVFSVESGVDAMTVCSNHVWIALQNGAIEVRNVHTGQVQHTFQPVLSSLRTDINLTGSTKISEMTNIVKTNRIWVMLGVRNECAKESQVWLGLSCGTIEVYHGIKFVLLRQMKKHMAGVYCLTDSPDGSYVFSGAADFLIAQWRVDSDSNSCSCSSISNNKNNYNSKSNCLIRVFNGHTNYVRCLHAERGVLFSGSDDGTIKVWDVESGCVKSSLTFHSVFHPENNNDKLHYASSNNNNNNNNKNNNKDNSNNINVECGVSALCRVGVNMWSGDDHGTIVIWQLSTCNKLFATQPHSSRITVLRKIGGRVYSSSSAGEICIHDATNGSVVHRICDHTGSSIMSLLCVVEVDRYYTWNINTDNANEGKDYTERKGMISSWHHDEHLPMTRTREGVNDLRWYHNTHHPYTEMNKALICEQDYYELLIRFINNDTEEESAINKLQHSNESDSKETATSKSIAAAVLRLHRELCNAHYEGKEQRNNIKGSEEAITVNNREVQLLQCQMQKLTDTINKIKAEKSIQLIPSVTTSVPTTATAAVPSVVVPVPIPSVVVSSAPSAPQNVTSFSCSASSPTPNVVKPKSWLASMHISPPLNESAESKTYENKDKFTASLTTSTSTSATLPSYNITSTSNAPLPVPTSQTINTALQSEQKKQEEKATSSPLMIGTSQVTRSTSYEPNLSTLPPPPPPPPPIATVPVPPPPIAIVPPPPVAPSQSIYLSHNNNLPTRSGETKDMNNKRRLSL